MIAVLGLGVTGISVLDQFPNAKFAWDDNEERVEELKIKYPNVEFTHDIPWGDIESLVVSPGVPLYYPAPHRVIKSAMNNGVKITCDVDLFYNLNRNSKFIGITGTNGKSTTVSLIYLILRNLGFDVEIGGNIGVPILNLRHNADIYILELSSFQLDLCVDLRINGASIVNISEDHIDRHGSMERYKNAKKRIFRNQMKDDLAVMSSDFDTNAQVIRFSIHADVRGDIKVINGVIYDEEKSFGIPNEYLRSAQNSENVAITYTICNRLWGIPGEQIVFHMKDFVGLRHRCEFVRKVRGVNFVNDSKATNSASAIGALDSYKNIYWIAGGIIKENDISEMIDHFTHVKKAYFFGKDATKLSCICTVPYMEFQDMTQALEAAWEDAKKEENCTVLLSPAGASLDQWKNFEERGNHFCDFAVKIN